MLTIGAEMRGFGRGLALAAGVADASELDLAGKLGEDKKVAVRAVALLLEGCSSLTKLSLNGAPRVWSGAGGRGWRAMWRGGRRARG